MYENVCLNSRLVKQLKYRGVICNALNFLNEENKIFSNCLFLSLYLIFFLSYFTFYLIVLMKNTKCSQIISLYFSFNLLLLSLYIIIYIYIYIYIYISQITLRSTLILRHVA
jgi:hypothetical protein